MSTEVAPTQASIPVEFHGSAMEYFGIWIVNIILIILTLGIYTPWAKVRTNRYFYGSTHIEGSSFDYLANPIAILKGWLIAVAAFITYSLAVEYYPESDPVFIIIFIGLLPLIIVRAMAFRARNSAYRNIRFNFSGRYKEALFVFVLWMILVPISLGLLYPYVIYLQKRFFVEKSGYGETDFEFAAKASEFYKIYLVVLGFVVLLVLLFMGVGMFSAATLTPVNTGNPATDIDIGAMQLMQVVLMLLSFFMYIVIFAYIQAKTGNIIWNNVLIQGHGFESTLKVTRIAWIYTTNILAILLSFGLLIPWAKVRMVKYRLSQLAVMPAGDLGEFVQREQKNTSAVGEEMGDVFDIDIGL